MVWLVVWNINFIFPYIGNFIIPTFIFFRGVAKKPPVVVHMLASSTVNDFSPRSSPEVAILRALRAGGATGDDPVKSVMG